MVLTPKTDTQNPSDESQIAKIADAKFEAGATRYRAPMFGNVISFTDLKEQLLQAFDELETILSSHSGPFAANNIIGSKWRQGNDVDEFTKDGIKILRHLIVSEDAAGRFAARLTRFVGIAVDKRCHDGTTTSMLLTCKLAKLALSVMDKDLGDLARNRYSWNMGDVLDACLAYLEDTKITDDDILQRCEQFGIRTNLTEVRGAMAFHMAMISSKGDADLAEKVSFVVRSSPKKIYGMFKNTPIALETKERYILKKQDFDLAVRATLGIIQDYNYKNGTQYLAPNAVIFATANDIVSESLESIFLQAFIAKDDPRQRANLSDFGFEKGWEDYHGGVKQLIIMTPMLNDPGLIGQIVRFNKSNPTVKISWFNIEIHQRLRMSFDKTLHYMGGYNRFDDDKDHVEGSLIGLDRPVEVHLLGNTVTIKGLYERTGDAFHPLYDDPEANELYTRFRLETEELIEFANENITNPGLDSDEVTYLTSLYRSLTSQDIYDIEVGGTAHEQKANRTVYEDAIGAALSAVSEGVMFGGYGGLAKFCFDQPQVVAGQIGDAIIDLIQDSLRACPNRQSILEQHPDRWSYMYADINAAKSGDDDYLRVGIVTEAMLRHFLKRDPLHTVLIQAFGGFHEQFKRFRDFIPKIALSSSLADMRVQPGDDTQ